MIDKSSMIPFRMLKPTTHSDVEEISSTQVDPNCKNCHVRGSDAIDDCMITTLVHQVLASYKRSGKHFSSVMCPKQLTTCTMDVESWC